ncbi:flagellar assembly protein FliH [Bacillus sp. 1P06AnD]|uniref:flagellar assembly protein FliH n=1 Tax=Bacillus sp. 1P06AnD TaxID=3132208 RepID=UPI0039A2035A
MSRIIKSSWMAQEKQEEKRISIVPLTHLSSTGFQDEQSAHVNHHAMLEEAEASAQRIMDEANRRATEIKRSIEQEREKWELHDRKLLEESARDSGFNEGHAYGIEQGRQEMKAQIEMAQQVVLSAKKDYQNYLDSAEQTILDLSIAIASQILNVEIQEKQETFLPLVKKAIKEVRDYKEVQLRVHPKHYDFFVSQKAELLAIFPKETDLVIYPDEDMNETGCVIESAAGLIDAGIDSQLTEVKHQLEELLEGE